MPENSRLRRVIRTVALAAVLVAASSGPASAASLPFLRIDGAAAGDRVGTSVAPAGDVNGDGQLDVIVGAPGALQNPDGSSAGGAYVIFGPFQPGTTIDLADLRGRGFALRGTPGARGLAGLSVAGAGDVNGDGLADVIVGAPGATPDQEGPQTGVGKAYIVFGSRTPHDLDLDALGPAGITLAGQPHYFPDAFGWQVAGVGDVDRDGRADVAIAAPGNPGFEDEFTKGRAYVVFGRRTPGTISMNGLGRRGFKIGYDQVMSVAGVGDWNRDGRADVALTGDKQVYVVYGHRYSSTVDLAHLGRHGLTIRQKSRLQFQRATLAGGLDFSGDGRPDLAIGEPMSHYFGLGPANGGAVLVRGARSRRTVDLADPGRRAWEPATGVRGWMAGSSIALGRVNGDRRADIVMVAHGSLAVVYGSSSRSTLRLNALPPDRGFLVDGSSEPPVPGSPAGTGGFASTAVAGDLNSDGRDDLLAGAPFAGHQDRALAGSAYLLFAP